MLHGKNFYFFCQMKALREKSLMMLNCMAFRSKDFSYRSDTDFNETMKIQKRQSTISIWYNKFSLAIFSSF